MEDIESNFAQLNILLKKEYIILWVRNGQEAIIGDEQKDEDYRQHQCQVEKKRSYNPFYKGLCPVFR